MALKDDIAIEQCQQWLITWWCNVMQFNVSQKNSQKGNSYIHSVCMVTAREKRHTALHYIHPKSTAVNVFNTHIKLSLTGHYKIVQMLVSDPILMRQKWTSE